jgi:hypothetical protein
MHLTTPRFLKSLFLLVLVNSFYAFSADAPANTKAQVDFANFSTVMNLSEDGVRFESEASNSILARLAARELMTSGMTPKELYAKIETLLHALKPHLEKIMALQKAVNLDADRPILKCVEFGLCFGLFYGMGIRFSFGVIRTPRMSYPVVGAKIRFLNSSNRGEEFAGGLALELGAEHKYDANTDLLSFVEFDSSSIDGEVSNAILAGKYKSTVANDGTHASKGMLIGLFRDQSKVNHVGFRFPIKIPIYVYRFEKDLDSLLLKMMRALQTFDFESYAALFEKLKITISKVERKLRDRGLASTPGMDKDTLMSEHPMSSPGMLFHPRTLLRYAPDLTPGYMKLEGCDDALLGNRKKDNKAKTLLLGGGG